MLIFFSTDSYTYPYLPPLTWNTVDTNQPILQQK